MKTRTFLVFGLFAVGVLAARAGAAEVAGADAQEQLKQSLIYLEVSSYGYDPRMPWRHTDISQRSCYGVAVGDYEILTAAWNVRDSAFIKVRRFAQNEFARGRVKVVDYENNLSLITIDPNEGDGPMRAAVFSADYEKGAEARCYWLGGDGRIESGRGFIDRAEVYKSPVSFEKSLNYVVASASQKTSLGQVYCLGGKPIGIACWSNDNKEAGLIPAEAIKRFLEDMEKNAYEGFGAMGFVTSDLIDPAMRAYLKMPESVKNGVYVNDVYTIGTGSDALKPEDVILAIDGLEIDAYGRFSHPKYEELSLEYLVTSKRAGEPIVFEVWRDGRREEVKTVVKGIKARDMLVPYYEYDEQPEYVVTGGFVFQKLTRQYMQQWGEQWVGRVSPHFYHYYRDMAFKPTDERRDIVILSYVLPAEINLGYQDMGQTVVSKFNGIDVRSIADVVAAQKAEPDSKYDVVEFEMDNPKVVIPRGQVAEADAMIGQNYGIGKPVNIGTKD